MSEWYDFVQRGRGIILYELGYSSLRLLIVLLVKNKKCPHEVLDTRMMFYSYQIILFDMVYFFFIVAAVSVFVCCFFFKKTSLC